MSDRTADAAFETGITSHLPKGGHPSVTRDGLDREEGLIDALAGSFRAWGFGGLGRSNCKNYRQIALTWPTLGTRQTLTSECSPRGDANGRLQARPGRQQ